MAKGVRISTPYKLFRRPFPLTGTVDTVRTYLVACEPSVYRTINSLHSTDSRWATWLSLTPVPVSEIFAPSVSATWPLLTPETGVQNPGPCPVDAARRPLG